MTEASRVQKLLNEQNAEIDRIKNRIETLEAALYEIAHLNNMRDRFSSEIDNVITTVLGEKK
jgi:hypothetical protein